MDALHTIIFSTPPDISALVAIWLTRRFGHNEFPGADSARFQYVPFSDIPVTRELFQYYRSKGYLYIVGKGALFSDEEGAISSARCAARRFGVEHQMFLPPFIAYAEKKSVPHNGNMFELAHIFNALSTFASPELMLTQGCLLLDACILHALQNKMGNIASEFVDVPVTDTSDAVILQHIDTDCVNKMGKTRRKFTQHTIGVYHYICGTIEIVCHDTDVSIFDAVRLLRIRELEKGKKVFDTDDYQTLKELESADVCVRSPLWHMNRATRTLTRDCDVMKQQHRESFLTLEDIMEILCIVSHKYDFASEYKAQCQKDVCASSVEAPCPWYAWKLHRCRTIRSKQLLG